jgi:hypothetical protein
MAQSSTPTMPRKSLIHSRSLQVIPRAASRIVTHIFQASPASPLTIPLLLSGCLSHQTYSLTRINSLRPERPTMIHHRGQGGVPAWLDFRAEKLTKRLDEDARGLHTGNRGDCSEEEKRHAI